LFPGIGVTIEGESPVLSRVFSFFTEPRVAWDTWNPVWSNEDHLVRLNTPEWPIVESTVRERWKVPLVREWNRTWNRKLTSSGRQFCCWPRACWRM